MNMVGLFKITWPDSVIHENCFLVPSPNLSFLVTLQNHFLSYVTLLFFLFVVPTFDAKSSSWPRLIVSHPLQSCFPPQPWPCYCSPLTCVTTTSARWNPFLVSHVTGWRFSLSFGFFNFSPSAYRIDAIFQVCLTDDLPSFYFDVFSGTATGTEPLTFTYCKYYFLLVALSATLHRLSSPDLMKKAMMFGFIVRLEYRRMKIRQ